MAKVSRGSASLTFVDLTDGRQLVSYIQTNQQKQVIFDPDTGNYTPNYLNSPMVLTPNLRVYGETGDQAANAKTITWYVQENSTGEMVEIKSGNATYVLDAGTKKITINKNIFTTLQSVTFVCEFVFADPVTNQEYLAISEVELDKLQNGSSAVNFVIDTPDGMIIHNGERNLRAQVTMYKGTGTVTANQYQWYHRDPEGVGDSDSGAGWVKLTSGAPHGTSGYTTAILTITPKAILGSETFLCIAKYNGQTYKSTITLTDITDPYSVVILGSGTFKNSEGSNRYTCKVYQNGEELEGQHFQYDWRMYNSAGEVDPTFQRTGKTITVDAEDFEHTAVLECTVDDNE